MGSQAPIVSDIAVFVLKRDAKLQLTNFQAPKFSAHVYGQSIP